ncbi:MAG: sensor domain-containing diguanylate cyclase [Gemmatimonadota bacterium]|nr:MAG: sensor domain-containing diguanylate cyclase [Gemmatimonadota bacterium]
MLPPTSPVSRAVTGKVPKAFRLESIKSRIVGLALLATLIPSLGMAWISYVQNRAALTDKITEELQGVSEQTAREIDLWLKERLYDIRVFASSYEVTENIERARRSAGGGRAGARLKNYLTSVEERFPDYTELLVIDREGQPLATSAERPGDVHLSPGWLDRVAADQTVIGEAYWDEQLGRRFMTIAVPVTAADRTLIGALVANVSYRAVVTLLLVLAPGESGSMFVITPEGSAIVGSGAEARPIADRRLESSTTQLLFASEGKPITYTDGGGTAVIGTLKRVPRLDWAVVAEIPVQEAYSQIERLRDVSVALVSGLLLVGGFIAYRLSLLIVRPLDRLTTGAAEVAAGDLAVDLPVGKGEVGYLTEVFNAMVSRLREGREQLEALLVTDPLTGVSNRRHLMETLESETHRADRSERSFSILMVDVDRFKKFNDTFGHIAGDEALKVVAEVLQEATREVDHIARYGGEEFLVVLPDTDIDGAVISAERIRGLLAERIVAVGEQSATLTLSTGVAEFPIDGDSPASLIASADAALYLAKRRGRDRVVRVSRRRKTAVARPSKATRRKKDAS